jgi:hypothetical protein
MLYALQLLAGASCIAWSWPSSFSIAAERGSSRLDVFRVPSHGPIASRLATSCPSQIRSFGAVVDPTLRSSSGQLVEKGGRNPVFRDERRSAPTSAALAPPHFARDMPWQEPECEQRSESSESDTREENI